jgi:hypothetical protein
MTRIDRLVRNNMRDIIIRNHGTLCIMVAITHAGEDWIAEHIPEDAQRWGKGIVVEPRYIEDIVEGARADGLEV